MKYLENYWVQKRYRCLDGEWMLFLWGFQEDSMEHALQHAANKDISQFGIQRISETEWKAFDPETDTRYIVEKRDTVPELNIANISTRDQTVPPKPNLKKMPIASSLFKPAKTSS